MILTKVSMLTNEQHTMDIPVTQEQLDAWNGGMLIQEAMPNLTADQREFLLTGSTAEEWDKEFKEEE